jgi:ribonuclease H2 subunit B
MFEEAAMLLAKTVPKDRDPSMTISEKDILHLSSLQCVRSALKRLCDVKGISTIKFAIDCRLISLRGHT